MRNNMKKTFFISFVILLSFVFCCCAKNKEKKIETTNEQVQIEKQIEQKVEISPEMKKLNIVFEKMSDRAKNEISNIKTQEFLDDLQVVLQAEKSFPQDDLSLYYLIDKKHFVGKEYEPTNLVKLVKNADYDITKNNLSLRVDVEESLRKMAQAAQQDGVKLVVSSTYRSYQYQENTFNYWVSVDGLEEAERESARPGTSQHQLGAAVDFGSIDDDFALTDQSKWLEENAANFGWSLSFPQGYEDVTGYRWESWHYRYIGKEACAFQKKWFGNIQQFMIEFIDEWKKTTEF